MIRQTKRLDEIQDELKTLRVNSSNKIPFTYNGKVYHGVEGDTIATALYSNQIRIFSRSFKYHRPRGLYSLDGQCANTMMEVDGIPNINAEKTILQPHMKVKPENVIGSAENDLLGILDKFDNFMPAGFYYRTMHKPAAVWPLAMKGIRRMAGHGKISPHFKMKGKFDEIFPTCDICVIGGGPAGMKAALAAARAGHNKKIRVILLEARPWLGGFYDYRTSAFDNQGKPLNQRAAELAKQVEEHPRIRVFKHTSMIGAYNNHLITAFQIGDKVGNKVGGKVGDKEDAFTERYIELRAESVVVATGCIERPLLFEHNERPGVMQPETVHRLAHTYGIIPGKVAVFSIGHDLALEAVLDLHRLGLKIKAVADARPSLTSKRSRELAEEITSSGIEYLSGWTALSSHGKQVNKVTLGALGALGAIDGNNKRILTCDLIAAAAGLTPLTGPLSINQAKLKYDSHTNFFLPYNYPEKTHAAGRMLGLGDPLSIEKSGELAGLKAVDDCGISQTLQIKKTEKELKSLPGPEEGCKLITAPVSGRKSFICFDEDVPVKHIKQSIAQGFDVPELIKRYTAAGLGPGQAGIPGHNLPLFVADHQKLEVGKILPTNQRAPQVPTYVATYSGTNHNMFKKTPIHHLQEKDGGTFRRIGVWKRARYFSSDLSCKDEILNVRNNVGLLDGSTLGKFRIHGPDALKALQRVYISNMSRLKPGRVKYSAMCNEDGCVIDDGVVVMEKENDYYFTTSTGRAGETVGWVRYFTRFENWDFSLVNLTDSMGVINLSGPNSRKVLEKVTKDDVSNEGFSFSGYKQVSISGIPTKAMRLGFVGELSYEFHVASSLMESAWNSLMEAGKEFSIKNFGVEAQNVLRMEKFHIILGQESEQRTNLLDVHMGFLWARKQIEANKVGAFALKNSAEDPNRFRLVGIRMKNDKRPARDGSLIVDKRIRGYVCTMRRSFTTGQAVGMALVEKELSQVGTKLDIYEDECKGRTLPATVVETPFYDPDGSRMKI